MDSQIIQILNNFPLTYYSGNKLRLPAGFLPSLKLPAQFSAVDGELAKLVRRWAGAGVINPVVNYWWPIAFNEVPVQEGWAFHVAYYTPWLTCWWNTPKMLSPLRYCGTVQFSHVKTGRQCQHPARDYELCFPFVVILPAMLYMMK